jgi:hypothetical protein
LQRLPRVATTTASQAEIAERVTQLCLGGAVEQNTLPNSLHRIFAAAAGRNPKLGKKHANLFGPGAAENGVLDSANESGHLFLLLTEAAQGSF